MLPLKYSTEEEVIVQQLVGLKVYYQWGKHQGREGYFSVGS